MFDLRCRHGHVFEAWFASGAAYGEQQSRGLVQCPVCGDGAVEKAVTAAAIPAKANSRTDVSPAAKAMIRTMAAAQSRALEGSSWVGDAFAARARAMHDGDEPARAIHGQATLAEATALVEEGVPVVPLPLPVIPPDQAN